MAGHVSCRLYLLLDALENFYISLDLRSREISNFPTHLEVNTTDRKHTVIIFYIYDIGGRTTEVISMLVTKTKKMNHAYGQFYI